MQLFFCAKIRLRFFFPFVKYYTVSKNFLSFSAFFNSSVCPWTKFLKTSNQLEKKKKTCSVDDLLLHQHHPISFRVEPRTSSPLCCLVPPESPTLLLLHHRSQHAPKDVAQLQFRNSQIKQSMMKSSSLRSLVKINPATKVTIPNPRQNFSASRCQTCSMN